MGDVNDKYIYIEDYGGIYIPNYKNVKYNKTDKQFLNCIFLMVKNLQMKTIYI